MRIKFVRMRKNREGGSERERERSEISKGGGQDSERGCKDNERERGSEDTEKERLYRVFESNRDQVA